MCHIGYLYNVISLENVVRKLSFIDVGKRNEDNFCYPKCAVHRKQVLQYIKDVRTMYVVMVWIFKMNFVYRIDVFYVIPKKKGNKVEMILCISYEGRNVKT